MSTFHHRHILYLIAKLFASSVEPEKQTEVKFNALNKNPLRIHYYLKIFLLMSIQSDSPSWKSCQREVKHNEKKTDSMKTLFMWLQFSFTLLALYSP